MEQQSSEKLYLLLRGLSKMTRLGNLKQRLVRLQLKAKALKGDDLARKLIAVLAQKSNIQSNSLFAGKRDRASVNG